MCTHYSLNLFGSCYLLRYSNIYLHICLFTYLGRSVYMWLRTHVEVCRASPPPSTWDPRDRTQLLRPGCRALYLLSFLVGLFLPLLLYCIHNEDLRIFLICTQACHAFFCHRRYLTVEFQGHKTNTHLTFHWLLPT